MPLPVAGCSSPQPLVWTSLICPWTEADAACFPITLRPYNVGVPGAAGILGNEHQLGGMTHPMTQAVAHRNRGSGTPPPHPQVGALPSVLPCLVKSRGPCGIDCGVGITDKSPLGQSACVSVLCSRRFFIVCERVKCIFRSCHLPTRTWL